MNLSKKARIGLAVYVVWTFAHLVLLVDAMSDDSEFFDSWGGDNGSPCGPVWFLICVVGPLVVWAVYVLIGKRAFIIAAAWVFAILIVSAGGIWIAEENYRDDRRQADLQRKADLLRKADLQRTANRLFGQPLEDGVAQSGTEGQSQISDDEYISELTSRIAVSPSKENILGVEPEMVWVPGGTFQMGSPSSENGRGSNETLHTVTLGGFSIGKYAVTNAQYSRFKPGHSSWNYLGVSLKGDNQPVVNVSWNDATAFCEWLSLKTGYNYSLPTEAQWEYACRAGTTTPFYFGATISSSQANYDGTYTYGNGVKGIYRRRRTATGSFAPNAFGLYDMHGNVWEWCSDWYDEGFYGCSPPKNPVNTSVAEDRVLRGGSWNINPHYCRSASRVHLTSDFTDDDLGFRVSRTQ